MTIPLCHIYRTYSDDVNYVSACTTPKKHPLRSTIQHWQLRDLISCPSNKELVHVVGNNVALYNSDTKQTLTLFKDLSFPPTCMTTGCGYLAVGGERSQLMVRQLHSNWFSHSSVGGCINNALCIADHSFTAPLPSETALTTASSIVPPPSIASLSSSARSLFGQPRAPFSPSQHQGGAHTRLYVCNNDETIKIYSLPDLQRITSISLPTAVNNLSVSPDGRKMVAVGDSNQIFLYDITSSGGYHRSATYVAQGAGSCFSCSWNYASEKFAVASQDGFVYVWDVRHREKLAKFVTKQYPHEKGAARNVKFSSSGSIDLLAFSEHTSYVHLVDARTFNQRQTIRAAAPGTDQHISGLAFTPDSKSLFVALPTSMIKLPEIPRPAHAVVQAPASPPSAGDARSSSADNPFHMPTEEEVFRMKGEEISGRKEVCAFFRLHDIQRVDALHNKAKEQARRLKIYEKGVKRRRNFKELLAIDDAEQNALVEQLKSKKEADKVLVSQQMKGDVMHAPHLQMEHMLTRAVFHGLDRHLGRDNLQEFISKKREMFLLQYALGVKKDEIRKLEDIALAEEQKLLDDEKSLEEDAAKFDAFLKENDKNSVEAIKRAEAETKAKLERISEIKKLNIQIMSIRSDMSKNEDQLKDYQRYRQFLEKLTPAEWLQGQQKHQKGKDQEADNKKKEDEGDAPGHNKSSAPKSKGGPGGNKSKVQFNKKGNAAGTEETADSGSGQGSTFDDPADDYYSDDDEPFSLFFTTPQQLLDLFSELEENNLALIQNCQETEETLEELRTKISETESKMVKETEALRSQIQFLEQAIEREEKKAHMLEEKSKMSATSLNEADQEHLLSELNAKVKEVYRRCIGDAETNISTLQMLTSVENRLESLFELIEIMPPDKVEKAERMKDKERRQRAREEKLDAQRAMQEERIQRALERARAPVKKKTGKPVVFRSAPPQKKKKKEEDTKNKEEEDLAYYWE
ncbi:hypothetical protein RI367_007318 [Sorochytrium milnesiophthora]